MKVNLILALSRSSLGVNMYVLLCLACLLLTNPLTGKRVVGQRIQPQHWFMGASYEGQDGLPRIPYCIYLWP